MDVTVVVATYGDDEWRQLALERAVPSAEALRVPVMAVHRSTLCEARNDGLAFVGTEWVCFLDADDELEPGFMEAMEQASADVRAPSLRQVVHEDHAGHDCRQEGIFPMMPMVVGHEAQHRACDAGCLTEGNWVVVGAVARTQLIRDVGGWHDYPFWEDWDLWLRCQQAGASFEAVPDAVYRAHVRADSRNRAPSTAAKVSCYGKILKANGLLG